MRSHSVTCHSPGRQNIFAALYCIAISLLSAAAVWTCVVCTLLLDMVLWVSTTWHLHACNSCASQPGSRWVDSGRRECRWQLHWSSYCYSCWLYDEWLRWVMTFTAQSVLHTVAIAARLQTTVSLSCCYCTYSYIVPSRNTWIYSGAGRKVHKWTDRQTDNLTDEHALLTAAWTTFNKLGTTTRTCTPGVATSQHDVTVLMLLALLKQHKINASLQNAEFQHCSILVSKIWASI